MTILSTDAGARRTADAPRAAVAGAIGSVRAEGLELDSFGSGVLSAVADGSLTTREAHAALLLRYRRPQPAAL